MTAISKRWRTRLLLILVLALLVALTWRVMQSRQQAQAKLKAPVVVLPLDLSANDVWTVQSVSFSRTVEISGGLKAVQSAALKAKVAAEIKTLTVREGDTVKAGQVVGQLDTAEFDLRLRQAEQTAASSRGQWEIAQRNLANNRALVAQGFISATGLETSVSNELSAKANYEAAQAAVALARKSLGDAALVSPISGQVASRLAQVGERVGVDTKILELVDISRLELEAALAPEDVAEVRIGQTARLQVDGAAQPLTATVVRINPGAQAGSRSVMVYLQINPNTADDSGGRLRQGLFARGQIEVQQKAALALPASSLRNDLAQASVQWVDDSASSPQVRIQAVTVTERGEMLMPTAAAGTAQREAAVLLASPLPIGTPVLRAATGLLREGTLVNWPPKSASSSNASPTAATAANATPAATPAASSARP